MSSGGQRATWLREWLEAGKPEDWRARFVSAGPYSKKVRCRECGSLGYPGVFSPHPWQIGCLTGHQTCPDCGCPTRNLGSHRKCKLHHGRCCQHLNTQYREVQQLLGMEELER